jgi:hypothetical protein
MKCPCIKKGEECGANINLSDPNTLDSMRKMFETASQDAQNNVAELFLILPPNIVPP